MITISVIFCNDNHFYICIEYKSSKDNMFVILSEGKKNSTSDLLSGTLEIKQSVTTICR